MARTFLQTVQTVVTSLGETPPSNLTAPSTHTKVAMGAVNDAIEDIYGRARWEFRLKQYYLTLVEGDPVYALPEDFGEMHTTFLPLPGEQTHIVYIPYPDLLAQYPDMRLLRQDAANDMAGYVLPSISGATSYAGKHQGTPRYFSFNGSDLVVWPAPDDAHSDLGVQLCLSYYRLPKELTAAGETLPLPPNLWPACTQLAQAFTKQYLEFDDYRIDEQRAERMIALQLQRKTKRSGAPLRFRVRAC